MIDNKGKKGAIQATIAAIISIIIVIIGSNMFQYDSGEMIDANIETAKVIEILDVQSQEIMEGVENKDVTFSAEIMTGEFEGETVEIVQTINDMFFPKPAEVQEGDRILASNADVIDDGIDDPSWYYISEDRTNGIIILVVAFAILTLIIGRGKGIAAVVSLGIAIATIFLIYIPAILSGENIYMATILVTLFIILSSLIILNGANKKTLCAIVGNAGGILIAGILALVINSILSITGAIDGNYLFLTMLEGGVSIDLKALVWGGVLIGALGAVMDVSMTIASSMNELSDQMKDKNFKTMVKSGMNIGRDTIGTMTNTLILAYVGSSLATILLFASYNRNLSLLLNLEMIIVEIVQAIVGSFGILLAVPVTVLFSAWIFNKEDASTQKTA